MVDDPRALPLEVRERHDHVREPDAARLLGAEALAGERVPAELADADRVGKSGTIGAAVSPQRTSAIENSALSAATTTSQAAMMPVPPPKQAPCTSATVGAGDAFSRRIASAVARDTRTFSSREALAHGVDPREVGAGLEVLPVAPDHHGAQAGLRPSASSAASIPRSARRCRRC